MENRDSGNLAAKKRDGNKPMYQQQPSDAWVMKMSDLENGCDVSAGRPVPDEKVYYEEQVIDGVLSYRWAPNDPFTPYTAEQLTIKFVDVARRMKEIKNLVN